MGTPDAFAMHCIADTISAAVQQIGRAAEAAADRGDAEMATAWVELRLQLAAIDDRNQVWQTLRRLAKGRQ